MLQSVAAGAPSAEGGVSDGRDPPPSLQPTTTRQSPAPLPCAVLDGPAGDNRGLCAQGCQLDKGGGGGVNNVEKACTVSEGRSILYRCVLHSSAATAALSMSMEGPEDWTWWLVGRLLGPWQSCVSS